MKKLIFSVLTIILAFELSGCAQKPEQAVNKTVKQTFSKNVEEATLKTYYEMSDGTWKTGDYIYRYRLEITGRLNSAAKDSTFIYLSNIKDISFEQAWKASGLSSNLNDYFSVEDAVLVAMK